MASLDSGYTLQPLPLGRSGFLLLVRVAFLHVRCHPVNLYCVLYFSPPPQHLQIARLMIALAREVSPFSSRMSHSQQRENWKKNRSTRKAMLQDVPARGNSGIGRSRRELFQDMSSSWRLTRLTDIQDGELTTTTTTAGSIILR